MKLMQPGTELDGFTVKDCIHSGSMAHIYRVRYSRGAPDPGFPMAMKVPRMTAGDGAENIVSFEVEHQILQTVTGSHVPRFVAAGDLQRVPYLVMEYVQGQTLQHWLDQPQSPAPAELARLGVAVALAKLNGHDPYAYLKDVLTRLPTQRASQIGELLPHRWQPPLQAQT